MRVLVVACSVLFHRGWDGGLGLAGWLADGRAGCATAGVVVVLAIVAVRRAVVCSVVVAESGTAGDKVWVCSRACAEAATRNRQVCPLLLQ